MTQPMCINHPDSPADQLGADYGPPLCDWCEHAVFGAFDEPSPLPTQAQVKAWLDSRLPGRTLELQTLVLAEEVGELCRAVVKRAQGIRGSHAEWTDQLRAEAGNVFLTLYALAADEGFDLHDAAADKWAVITSRDTTAHRPSNQTPSRAGAATTGDGIGGTWTETFERLRTAQRTGAPREEVYRQAAAALVELLREEEGA